MRELERDLTDTPDSTPADPEGRTAPSRIVIVGPGRAGGAIARAARAAGLEVALIGRDDDIEVADPATSAALLCVPDGAIAGACRRVAAAVPAGTAIGHVSGATTLDALESAQVAGCPTFSLHPLQTIPTPDSDLTGAPCAVAGSSASALAGAKALASALGMRPFEVPEDGRAAYHAAAAMASNFLVALEESAAELLAAAGVDDPREALAPLVLRSAANWADAGRAALTGPIARGDEATVAEHVRALGERAPELAPLYEALAERTRALARRGGSCALNPTNPPHLPRVLRTKAELREALAPARRAARSIGLVPTMGALHEGHESLIRAARERCDVVVMSLFVNPAQFGPDEDLESYPHDEEGDVRRGGAAGADLVYAPAVDEVYPDGFATHVHVEGLTDVLCGDPARRGAEHFQGVTTVVAKLLGTVAPDVAFFGQKDAQQALVIRRMVRDLDFATEVAVLPTVREPDGLALSSRNRYLTPDERKRAAGLWLALETVRKNASAGASVDGALDAGRRALAEAGVETEYLEARHADDLTPARSFNGRPVLVAVAGRVGKARLIDNVVLGAGDPATN